MVCRRTRRSTWAYWIRNIAGWMPVFRDVIGKCTKYRGSQISVVLPTGRQSEANDPWSFPAILTTVNQKLATGN